MNHDEGKSPEYIRGRDHLLILMKRTNWGDSEDKITAKRGRKPKQEKAIIDWNLPRNTRLKLTNDSATNTKR